MIATSFTRLSTLCFRSACGWLQALRQAHRERLRACRLARRERLRMGYRHIPQRLWDRRSALFVER